jgi:hypothetical protein
MRKRFSLLAVTLLLPAVCLADKANERPVAGQTLATFERDAAAVREGMEPGGNYGYIRPEDKARVEKRLDDMQKLLGEHPGALAPQDKMTLLNEQEELNALLLQNDNNRLICDRSAHTGSRIPTTTCQTYGQQMQRQERDRHALNDLQKQPQTQRAGGP